MASLFTIPGNIKQQWLPFQLNPGKGINADVSGSRSIEDPAQVFSFRNNGLTQEGSSLGKLNVCPSSFQEFVNNDLAYRLLYPQSNLAGEISFNTLLDAIPGIQIREFLPDTKLDQCINFFGDIMDKVKDLLARKKDTASTSENGGGDKNKQNSIEVRWKIIKTILWYAYDYITAVNQNNIYSSVFKTQFNTSIYPGDDLGKQLVLNFPYTLYYRLQSCVTTNYYELPYKSSDQTIYNSDGTPGWKGGSAIGSLPNFIKNIPGLGGLFDKIIGNIRVNYMPYWESEEGFNTQPRKIQIQFDLFNDTLAAAKYNFLFVNTLIPNNMWIQYGMFQHSPNLYDIKIEGFDRMFACSGQFSVKALGVVRDPPLRLVDDLVDNHGGIKVDRKQLRFAITNQKLIKIPDVYQVTMEFSSLLPANFNNFLFQYAANNKVTQYHFTNNLSSNNSLVLNSSAAPKAVFANFNKDVGEFINNEEAQAKYRESSTHFQSATETDIPSN